MKGAREDKQVLSERGQVVHMFSVSACACVTFDSSGPSIDILMVRCLTP